jgi:hypothetical protein
MNAPSFSFLALLLLALSCWLVAASFLLGDPRSAKAAKTSGAGACPNRN